MTKILSGIRLAFTVADMVSHARHAYFVAAGWVRKYGPPIAQLVRTVRIKLAVLIAPKNIIGG